MTKLIILAIVAAALIFAVSQVRLLIKAIDEDIAFDELIRASDRSNKSELEFFESEKEK